MKEKIFSSANVKRDGLVFTQQNRKELISQRNDKQSTENVIRLKNLIKKYSA